MGPVSRHAHNLRTRGCALSVLRSAIRMPQRVRGRSLPNQPRNIFTARIFRAFHPERTLAAESASDSLTRPIPSPQVEGPQFRFRKRSTRCIHCLQFEAIRFSREAHKRSGDGARCSAVKCAYRRHPAGAGHDLASRTGPAKPAQRAGVGTRSVHRRSYLSFSSRDFNSACCVAVRRANRWPNASASKASPRDLTFRPLGRARPRGRRHARPMALTL